MVYAGDLKSPVLRACGFESHLRHLLSSTTPIEGLGLAVPEQQGPVEETWIFWLRVTILLAAQESPT